MLEPAEPTTSVDPSGTRARLLDAAERLFAETGIAHTTLRQITKAADANLAAVNYHFGSRNGLLAEVFARRIQPVNEERLARLERVETEAGDDPANIEDILQAFIAPAFELRRESEGQGAYFFRLIGRAHTDPSDELRDVVQSQFEEVALSFAHAIARALPRLSPMEIHWRFRFTIGAMAFTMIHRDFPLVERESEADEPESDEDVQRRLVSFLAAGFRSEPERVRS
jgi:AcrR family transcriptional regulator